MILLEVEDYCDDCPDFEAYVDKTAHSFFDWDGDVKTTDTIISCLHNERCENIRKYLEEKTDNKQCSFCYGDEPLFGLDEKNVAFIDSNGKIDVWVNGVSISFYVEYCPKCGRRFGEERRNRK